MPYMQGIEAAVCEYDAPALLTGFAQMVTQFVSQNNFSSHFPHVYFQDSDAALRIASESSSRETVAVPRFITTRPPAIFAMCAASSADAPHASPKVNAASTVSPAPV